MKEQCQRRVWPVVLAMVGFLTLLWCGGHPVQAATYPVPEGKHVYYVDATAGNDSNSGTSTDQAWQSLAQVNQTTFQPGDAILLKAGAHWTGTLAPKGSGSAAQPIILGAYGDGAKPVIDGAGQENTVSFLNQQYWEVRDLELTNKEPGLSLTTFASSPRRGLLILGADYNPDHLTKTDPSVVTTLHGFNVHDLYIHDIYGQDAKDLNGSAGIQVAVRATGLVSGVLDPAVVNVRTTFDDITIKNNRIAHVNRSGIILYSNWRSRTLLRADNTYGDPKVTPWTPITHVVIEGNSLTDIGGDGIATHMTDGALVAYNYLNGFNTRSAGYNAGMWAWDADNATFQYNEATGGVSTRDGMPWDFDQGEQGTLYQYNYSHDNAGGTLLFCSDTAAETGAGTKNGIFRYNLSVNDRYQLFTNCSGTGVQNIDVYNNTFYVGQGLNTNLLVNQNAATGVTFKNNIFYNLGTGTYVAKPTWHYANNLFYGNNQPTTSVVPDAFMVKADPQFKDPTPPGTIWGNDITAPRDAKVWQKALAGFTLQPESPAVNTGQFISLATTTHPGQVDLYGNALYNGNPDIGAYEAPLPVMPAVAPWLPVAALTPATVSNGDFEDTTKQANRAPWNFQWNGAITKAKPANGLYSAELKAANDGASLEQTLLVSPNTTYTITAKVKVGTPTDKLNIGAKWTAAGQNADARAAIPATPTEYQDVTYTFTTGDTTSATIYFYRAGGATASSFVDDVKIQLNTPDPVVTLGQAADLQVPVTVTGAPNAVVQITVGDQAPQTRTLSATGQLTTPLMIVQTATAQPLSVVATLPGQLASETVNATIPAASVLAAPTVTVGTEAADGTLPVTVQTVANATVGLGAQTVQADAAGQARLTVTPDATAVTLPLTVQAAGQLPYEGTVTIPAKRVPTVFPAPQVTVSAPTAEAQVTVTFTTAPGAQVTLADETKTADAQGHVSFTLTLTDTAQTLPVRATATGETPYEGTVALPAKTPAAPLEAVLAPDVMFGIPNQAGDVTVTIQTQPNARVQLGQQSGSADGKGQVVLTIAATDQDVALPLIITVPGQTPYTATVTIPKKQTPPIVAPTPDPQPAGKKGRGTRAGQPTAKAATKNLPQTGNRASGLLGIGVLVVVLVVGLSWWRRAGDAR
ncbi:carbohydrate binding domain-containing protein [Lacticaseibacillus daqingensis]|uniref:carbohydrate binding domain-containing protein n=1 Tax=Lacticaseibacillus daqingensis TaxID=2486014 RepID=UPI000F79F96B|nr:carbohydrate binding domain-containing protein [Lacticaseibacillus daqingensis]